MIIDHPPCAYEHCRKPLIQRDGEDSWSFRRRKYCDKTCSKNRRGIEGPARIAAAETRACVVCAGPMRRRVIERVRDFENRGTCSPPCAQIFRGTRGTQQAAMPGRRLRSIPIQLDDDLMNYGKGFGSQNIDPGDGGPMRLSKPDDGLALSVAGRYL